MAFSQGQLIFALVFFVLFVVAMFFAYRSDLKKLKPYKKDGFKVLIFIIVVMTLFYFTITFLGS